jgi:LPS-assembly protein
LPRVRPTALALLALVPGLAAASGWPLCPPLPALPRTGLSAPEPPGATRAVADRATSAGPVTRLEGDVEIRRGGRHVTGDRVTLDRARDRARAEGDASFATGELGVTGSRGELDLDTGAFSMRGADYQVDPAHAQGRAGRIRRDDDGVSRLEDATWSTCPRGAEAWHLRGGAVKLDPNTRQGTARNVTLWLGAVPVLYAPWFRFPIGQGRLSGFLTPRIGSSSESGTIVSVPWYWNIHPAFDATLTPTHYTDRGTQLRSEWRWLGPAGYWQLDNEYLPDDDLAGTDRVYTRVQQRASLGRWGTRIDAADASDRDYFDDLGDDLALSSQTHLRRRADLSWSGGATAFRARLQSYQTLDESIPARRRPYAQLPQLTLRTRGAPGPLETRLESELVRFERDASDTATRLRLVPAVTWPLEAPGWFLRPRLALDHTEYSIDRETSSGPERIGRTLPVTSIDAGLVFDRFGTHYQQTLEPRLFYAYIPAQDQDDIPVFDSGRYSFSFAQLFRERRFTGGDRLGDTNRLTAALTGRVLERDSGRQLLRASVGGSRYFADREVTLPAGTSPEPLDDNASDLIAELAAYPSPAWSARATVQWDPGTERTERQGLDLRYRGPGGGVANLGYRTRRAAQEQIDVSGAWPITGRWQLVGRRNYSLLDERNIETVTGVQYDSCCWRFRAVARRYLNEDDSPDGVGQSDSLYFELTLKGLGPIGAPAGTLLERAILGYSDSTP